ncbi:hypothetical protein [Sediminibacterium sp.]|uniref:hypothetical protein n=1 Tax=Sediminibacterium sp. TaxID=1917865 RepID=UPI0025F7D8E5|nr:hypothetical protein [Sediminibacterium sp.]MBW0179310.1 hypothetical protein [Sediminibacterium sp.]
MNLESSKRKLMRALQSIPENELTKHGIIPLLEKLEFKRVEFYGGPTEHGKDIIFWEPQKLGGDRLLVAQVKHYKFSKTASHSNSFQTVVNQLIASLKDRILGIDQFNYQPVEAVLISTYDIDVAVLQTRLGSYDELKNKVRIIDGNELVELFLKHYPEYAEKLLGVSIEIKDKLSDYLTNDILLKAIGFNKSKDLKVIYTDIDFSVGRQSTELFFDTEFKPIDINFTFDEPHFLLLLEDLAILSKEYKLDFIKVNLELLKREYDELKEQNELSEIKKKELRSTLSKIKNSKSYSESKKRNEIDKINLEITKENLNKKKFSATIPIYGSKITNQILQKRKWIEEQVLILNKKKHSRSGLKEFIIKSKKILNNTSLFFTRSYFTQCTGLESKKIHRTNHEKTRFKLPIGQIFDTGENIILLGEAGAGKSTSVQMYALNAADLDDPLVICIPLANTILNWIKNESNLDDDYKITNFSDAISKYLIFKGIKIQPHQFIEYLQTKRLTLLLDGLDEAIKPNPWLTKAIVTLSENYPNCQVVVTSRVSGKYIEEIPFFAVTLLPFTVQQRNTFIKQWFENGEKKFADKVKRHLRLNPELSEVVLSPLLLTTVCVLARNEVDLPITETKLYDDRLRLLTGYYDRVKNIQQRLETTPQDLEMVSRKLAFFLHYNNKREEDKETLMNMAASLLRGKMSANNAKRAVSELIDPCNILVPMTDDGKFGFGHLRFQEHLCAREISQHRGIKIAPLLFQNWWRGTLLLYAQMDNDISWLIEEVGEGETIIGYYETLKSMIQVSPKHEQEGLMTMLKTYFDENQRHKEYYL